MRVAVNLIIDEWTRQKIQYQKHFQQCLFGSTDTSNWVAMLCDCWMQQNDSTHSYHTIYNLCSRELFRETSKIISGKLYDSTKNRDFFPFSCEMVVASVKIKLLASLIMMLELNIFLNALRLVLFFLSCVCFHRIFTRSLFRCVLFLLCDHRFS